DLDVPIIRYPGGNFVSGYNWQDGIGPKSDRPTRLDYAWSSVESNQFGINEFSDWLKLVQCEGMIAVNLGTGTPQDAAYMVEYCNIEKGTYWSDLRRTHGYQKPHKFKVWCLGNEMDGPWQTCAMTAEEYGRKACETAKMLKWVDPSIELVVCGSSSKDLPTFPEWDRVVLEHCYDYVDYISLHRYYEYKGDLQTFLASFFDLNDFISTVKATADYVKAKNRSRKDMMLSLDEWNVWYITNMQTQRWKAAPAIAEDQYTLLDALVVGGLVTTIVNNADRVKIACLAQLVNALAPIHTSKDRGVLLHSTFYPFFQATHYAKGRVYRCTLTCESVNTSLYGDVPELATLFTYDEQRGEAALFVLNSNLSQDVELNLELVQFGELNLFEHQVLAGEDLFASNSFAQPDAVRPKVYNINNLQSDAFLVNLPKASWNMFRFNKSVGQ
ncbi:hypothetical protein OAP63_18570, partial [Vibrio sp.]|nr:hypothetical protein [Vibrio sp.]